MFLDLLLRVARGVGVGKRSFMLRHRRRVGGLRLLHLVRVDLDCKPEAGGACRLRFWWVPFLYIFPFCVLVLIVGVQSLIDLAGSERATSDKERTREGKYINTSLLTLGTVIGTLAENAAKNKAYVPPSPNISPMPILTTLTATTSPSATPN